MLTALVIGPGAWASTHFTDVSERAGIVALGPSERDGECLAGPIVCDADPMPSAAAVADVDGDGWPDVLLTNLAGPDLLFRNLGDGRFADVTAHSGLGSFALQSNGAAFGDIDNDGDPDLLVTVVGGGDDDVNGRNYLFVNDGTGRFGEEAHRRGVALSTGSPRVGYGVALGDYDGDGWLDIHTTDWLAGGPSRLLRNRGTVAPGNFEDVTERALVGLDDVSAIASALVDLDADGWQDLVVVGDFGSSRVFWNRGDGTFVDGTAAAGVATDESGTGAAFGDWDGDGDLDWFVTSIFDDRCEHAACELGHVAGNAGNRLYRNEGGRLFADATDVAGVRDSPWGFGAVFFDLDNDGDLDLAMASGGEMQEAGRGAAAGDPLRVWENDGGGRMRDVSERLGLAESFGKALLAFDYDRDGDVDLLVAGGAGAQRLFRNDLYGAGGVPSDRVIPGRASWLRVEVVGVKSNRDAVGAVVRVWPRPESTPQVQTVAASGQLLGHGETTLHFGLGEAVRRVHRVEVEFPSSGRTVVRRAMRPNRIHVLREPPFDELACGAGGFQAGFVVIPWALLRRRARRRAPATGLRSNPRSNEEAEHE